MLPTPVVVIFSLALLWGIWRFFPVWRFNGQTIRLHEWRSWRLVYRNEKLCRAIASTMNLKGVERLNALTPLVAMEVAGMEGRNLATEIVATGVTEALPWVDQMLESWQLGSQVLNGVYWAVERNEASEEFRVRMFQKLVPWLTIEGHSRDGLPDALFRLDQEWAFRVLTDADVLTPDLDIFPEVTKSLREHGYSWTTEQLRGWIHMLEAERESLSKMRAYLEVLKIYITHDQQDAEKRLKEIVYRKQDSNSNAAAEFLLEFHHQPMLRDEILSQVEREGPESLSPVHRVAWLADMGYIYPVIHCDTLAYYFTREEADRWPEVHDALKVIGAHRHAELLRSAAMLFGPSGPSLNHPERVKQFEAMGEQFPEKLRIMEERCHEGNDEKIELLVLIYLLENQV